MKNMNEPISQLLIVGLTTRTNNTNEMNPAKSKIAGLFETYISDQRCNDIKHRINPGVTYAVYTDYETDEHGDYTYYLGEAVSSFEEQDLSKFETLTIPESKYMKFTTDIGILPDIVTDAWLNIWQLDKSDFGSNRSYIADFELYDNKSSDPANASVDIYVGLT
jgi:predicted transcriptional regulator YdeE